MYGKVIDISAGVSPDTLVYPGDPIPEIKKVSAIETDGFAVSRILLGSHSGTHIDAPSHILKDGKTVDRLALEELIGRALVLDLSFKEEVISGNDLDAACKRFRDSAKVDILLLKTRNSMKGTHFTGTDPSTNGSNGSNGSVYLDESAADWILDNGLRTIGFDGLSVDGQNRMAVHRLLLGNGVNIVECLDLHAVDEGIYFFVCLPLKIVDCDGAPARAVLMMDS